MTGAETPGLRLTPKRRAMLERIVRAGPVLETALLASGGHAATVLSDLRNAGLVIPVDHPTVVDRRWGHPASAFEATEAGRAAPIGE